MSELAVVLGVLFFLLCLGLVFSHSARLGRLTLLDWAVLGMGGVYGLGWAIVAWVTLQGDNPIWEAWLLPFEPLYPVHTLCALMLLTSLWFGWLLGDRLRIVGAPIDAAAPRYTQARLAKAMWLLLIIAVVMQWLYTRAYGGFLGLLEYSAAIRSAIFTVENPLSFLQPFGGLAFFSSFGFFGLWLSRRRDILMVAGLVLSFLFSLYLLYSWLGRIAFLVYVASFALGALMCRRPKPLPALAGGGLLMLAVVVGAYYVSLWLNLKAADSLPGFLARELAFPFGSFFAQLGAGDNLFRGFVDFLFTPFFLLPSSWWSTWIKEVSQVNTALIMGAPKGEQGVTGSIPVDLLTLGLMQAHVFGIPIVGAMFGVLLRVVQRLIDRIPDPGVGAVFGAYAALKLAVLGVFYAQPALVVSGNFDFLISALVVAFFVYLPRIRCLPSRFALRVKHQGHEA